MILIKKKSWIQLWFSAFHILCLQLNSLLAIL